MTSPITWLITGSSRGLGFELVKQLIAVPSNCVIATCRDPAKATALHNLKGGAKGTLHIIALDIGDEASIRNSVKTVEDLLSGKGLDYLYNNAGILVQDSAFDFKYADMLKTLETNVAAPALMSQVYLPLIEKSKRKTIVHVSSALGSMGMDLGAQMLTYCVSKAALNMVTYKQAKARPDVISIALNPGWVKTDMGGENAELEPYESISAALKLVTSLTAKDSGKLFDYTGKVLPW